MMANATKTIKVRPGTELADLLDEVADAPVFLEKDGVRFRLAREEKTRPAEYDAAAIRSALRDAAGVLSKAEAEEMKAMIYRAREEGTRPTSRP